MTRAEVIRRALVAHQRYMFGSAPSWRAVRVRAVPEHGRPGWWVLHIDAPWFHLLGGWRIGGWGPVSKARRSRRRLLADVAAACLGWFRARRLDARGRLCVNIGKNGTANSVTGAPGARRERAGSPT